MHILPGWLWAVVMVILVIVGIASGEIVPMLIVVGGSVGLTALIGVIRNGFGGGDDWSEPEEQEGVSDQLPDSPQEPKDPASPGRGRQSSPKCVAQGQGEPTPASFYVTCPHCGERVYLEPRASAPAEDWPPKPETAAKESLASLVPERNLRREGIVWAIFFIILLVILIAVAMNAP